MLAIATLVWQSATGVQGLKPGETAHFVKAPVFAELGAVRGRLLDAFSGAPVVGATCELWSEDSDRPAQLASTVTSGADGAFVLQATVEGASKVRVRADGYCSTVVDGDEEVFLFPSIEPFAFRVLDLDGRPIAGARVRSHQTCRHAPPAVEGTSDADGRVLLANAPEFGSRAEYEVRASGFGALRDIYWEELGPDPVVYLPRRAEVRVRLVDEQGAALANRRFRQQGDIDTIFITDADGRAVLDSLFESRALALWDCARRGWHVEGWPGLDAEATLPPSQHPFAPENQASWPTLHVWPGEPTGRMHVQFGADSITRRVQGKALEFRVRPGEPVVVLQQGEQVWRAELAPWEGEHEFDLRDPANLFRARPAEGELVELAFQVRGDDGTPLEVEATLRTSGPEQEDHDPSPDGVRFRVHRGEFWDVEFLAFDHVTVHRQGRAEFGQVGTDRVVLPRRAEIDFTRWPERIEAPGWAHWPRVADYAVCDFGTGLDDLGFAPGSCRLLVELDDSRWLQLDLVLQPGEKRLLTLP